MSSSAFVAVAPALTRASSTVSNTSFVCRRVITAAPVVRSRVVMMSEKEKIPQGFTGYSETLNGRAAMIGFILAIATEALTGKGIIGQLSALGDVSTIASALGL